MKMMQKKSSQQLLIGAHTSAQGGVHNALLQGQEIGATTVQLFTSNQRQWKGKQISDEEALLFKLTLEETGLSHIMSHSSYLINLGSPHADARHKSQKTFKEELQRCHQLGIAFLNFHPGAALESTPEECLDRIAESLLALEDLANAGATRLLLETTAGQGSAVGWRFDEIGYLIDKLHKKIPMGVCIDTCHIFAAGYDIRTPTAWKETLKLFDEQIGLKHLYALHLNDSLKPFGSRRDRHACLGKGEIGMDCFEYIMSHPLLHTLPKYLETPDGPPVWKEEIALLRELAHATP